MKRLSSISGTILAGVLSGSSGDAWAGEPPSTTAYSCSVIAQGVSPRDLDVQICVEGTPLLVQPDNPQAICYLSRGQALWLHGKFGRHVQASVLSPPCNNWTGWVDEAAIGVNGICAM